MDRDEMIEPYRRMYEHTKKACEGCAKPGTRCCHKLYCELAIRWAKKYWDVHLEPTGHPTVPLMGEDGCVAAPHFRPLCTVHYCEAMPLGNNQQTAEWTQEYFDLRDRLSAMEMAHGTGDDF